MSLPIAQPDLENENDPLARGAAALPPTVGEGCLARFDPDSLNEESGTDFSAAAGLRSEPDDPPEPA